MTGVTVRPMRLDELPAVAALRWEFTQEFRGHVEFSREEFVAQFVAWARQTEASHRCFVAVRDDVVIGMAWLAITRRVPSASSLDRRSGDLQSVYVLPAERNAGLGGRLIEAVLAHAREMGLERVTVHSSEHAVSAYARHGFTDSPKLRHVKLV